jgi:hypothetical protein
MAKLHPNASRRPAPDFPDVHYGPLDAQKDRQDRRTVLAGEDDNDEWERGQPGLGELYGE